MVPERVVGIKVAQNNGVIAGRQGARIEAVLALVTVCSADGRPVHVDDGKWGLAEDAHPADLGGIVCGSLLGGLTDRLVGGR